MMKLKYSRYLPLCLALLVPLSTMSLPASAVELMRWERIPLQVPLHVGQERIVFVNKNVRVGFPATLNGKLRVQSTGGVVYLRAIENFTLTRLQLQDVENGELILLDVSASNANGKGILEQIKLIYQGELSSTTSSDKTTVSESSDMTAKTASKTQEVKITAPLPIALTRYAAQSLYAPLRILEPLPGVYSVSHSLPATLTTLLPSEPVTVTPLAAWSVQGYSVVALKLTNQSSGKMVLDPRRLQGTFYSATFQHHWLGNAGTPEDTTTLYLVITGRPDAAFLPEPVAPSMKTKGKTRRKSGERNNAD